MPAKFLFQDVVLKKLSFLLHAIGISLLNGVIQLASRFTSFSVDKMDSLSIEFHDFRSATDCRLPSYNASDSSAIDSFNDEACYMSQHLVKKICQWLGMQLQV